MGQLVVALEAQAGTAGGAGCPRLGRQFRKDCSAAQTPSAPFDAKRLTAQIAPWEPATLGQPASDLVVGKR
jgi:hypothetical protein